MWNLSRTSNVLIWPGHIVSKVNLFVKDVKNKPSVAVAVLLLVLFYDFTRSIALTANTFLSLLVLEARPQRKNNSMLLIKTFKPKLFSTSFYTKIPSSARLLKRKKHSSQLFQNFSVFNFYNKSLLRTGIN